MKMEKMVLKKVVLLALLLSLSCLWVANALEGESKGSTGQVKDVTPPRGGYCKYDDNCRDNCPGCAFTKCNYGVCDCSNCNTGEVRVITPQRGGPCSYDNICHNHCPGCRFTQCVECKCVCIKCYTPPLDLDKALEGEARVSGELRDIITPQRGGPCSYDNICHTHCPSCDFRKCVNGQCVCTGCNIPPILGV